MRDMSNRPFMRTIRNNVDKVPQCRDSHFLTRRRKGCQGLPDRFGAYDQNRRNEIGSGDASIDVGIAPWIPLESSEAGGVRSFGIAIEHLGRKVVQVERIGDSISVYVAADDLWGNTGQCAERQQEEDSPKRPDSHSHQFLALRVPNRYVRNGFRS